MVIPVIATWEAEGSGPLEAQRPVRISCRMKAPPPGQRLCLKHWNAPEEGTPKKLPSELHVHVRASKQGFSNAVGLVFGTQNR